MKRLVFYVVCVTLLVASLGAENVNVIKPKAGFTFDEDRGTFGVYTIDATGKRIPVFEENSDITAFYLMAGDKVYRLRKEDGITTRGQQTADGGILTYTISGLAEVAVEFTFMTVVVGRPADMIRVEVRVSNISGETQIFGIKGRFDTTLGEKDGSFFSAGGQDRIASESQLSSFSEAKWIKAADSGNTMRLLLYGEGITTPQSATLANKEGMNATVWDAKYTQGTSLGNTAMDIDWGQAQLSPEQITGVLFYISLGAGLPPVPKAPVSQIALVTLGPPIPVAVAVAPPPVVAVAPPPVVAVAPPPVVAPPAPRPNYRQYIPPPTPTHEYPRTEYPQLPAPALVQSPPQVQVQYPAQAQVQAQSPVQAQNQAQAQAQAQAQNQAQAQAQAQAPVQVQVQVQSPQAPVPRASNPPVVVYITPPARPVKPTVNTGNSTDADYARDLFDRIQRLGSGPGGVNGINREEIIRLNGELDGFLARTGQK